MMRNLMIGVMVALGLALISVAPAGAQGSDVPHSNGQTTQADYVGRAPKVGTTTTDFGGKGVVEHFQGAGDSGASAVSGDGAAK